MKDCRNNYIAQLENSMEETLKISSWSKTITLDAFTAKYLLSGSSYIDVRTKEEFNNGHLESALNIPYMFYTKKGWVKNSKFVDKVVAVCGKEDRLIVGCQDGARSEHACNDLRDAFRHVSNMGGGYSALVANGSYVQIEELEKYGVKTAILAKIWVKSENIKILKI
ncbi:hypothetical protein ABFX02_08G090200 [Erythranthe guttata]